MAISSSAVLFLAIAVLAASAAAPTATPVAAPKSAPISQLTVSAITPPTPAPIIPLPARAVYFPAPAVFFPPAPPPATEVPTANPSTTPGDNSAAGFLSSSWISAAAGALAVAFAF